jgi:hypothetical protein
MAHLTEPHRKPRLHRLTQAMPCRSAATNHHRGRASTYFHTLVVSCLVVNQAASDDHNLSTQLDDEQLANASRMARDRIVHRSTI